LYYLIIIFITLFLIKFIAVYYPTSSEVALPVLASSLVASIRLV